MVDFFHRASGLATPKFTCISTFYRNAQRRRRGCLIPPEWMFNLSGHAAQSRAEYSSGFFLRKLSPRSLNTVVSSKTRSSAHRSVEPSLKASHQRAGFFRNGFFFCPQLAFLAGPLGAISAGRHYAIKGREKELAKWFIDFETLRAMEAEKPEDQQDARLAIYQSKTKDSTDAMDSLRYRHDCWCDQLPAKLLGEFSGALLVEVIELSVLTKRNDKIRCNFPLTNVAIYRFALSTDSAS